MGKVDNKLKFFVTQCLWQIEKRENLDFHLATIVPVAKRFLAHFDDAEWQKGGMDESIYNMCAAIVQYERDIYTVIVLFVIVSMRIEVISKYSLRYVRDLALALEVEEILVADYDAYLNVFLSDEVYDSFMFLPSDEMCSAIIEAVQELSYRDVINEDAIPIAKVVRRYERDRSFTGKKCDFEYFGKMLADHLSPTRTKNILKVLKDLDDNLGRNEKIALNKKIDELEDEYRDDYEIFSAAAYGVILDCFVTHIRHWQVIDCKAHTLRNRYGQLYVEMWKTTKRVEGLSKDDCFERAILLYSRRALSRYSPLAWSKDHLDDDILFYFESLENDKADDTLKLVIFILYAEEMSKLSKSDLYFVVELALIFASRKILPSDFEKYISLLLDDRIYLELINMNDVKRLYCLNEIVVNTDTSRSLEERTMIARKILAKYSGRPYSPLFDGNYDLENIYRVLSLVLNDDMMSAFFDENDRKALDSIRNLAAPEFAELYDDLIAHISKIEARNDTKRILATKYILKIVLDYWTFADRGLKILKKK